MVKQHRFLFHRPAPGDAAREQCLKQLLQAYREESRSQTAIDSLEQELLMKLRILPVLRAHEEFTMTLAGAILSLRGRLLAFSVAAILLLSLSIGLRYQNPGPVGIEETLTYNADSSHRDPFLLSDEMDNGR